MAGTGVARSESASGCTALHNAIRWVGLSGVGYCEETETADTAKTCNSFDHSNLGLRAFPPRSKNFLARRCDRGVRCKEIVGCNGMQRPFAGCARPKPTPERGGRGVQTLQ